MIIICRPSSFRLVIVSWINPFLGYLDKGYNVEKVKSFEKFADADGFCSGLNKKGMQTKMEYVI